MIAEGLPPKYSTVAITRSGNMATSSMTRCMARLYVAPIIPPTITMSPMVTAVAMARNFRLRPPKRPTNASVTVNLPERFSGPPRTTSTKTQAPKV